MVRVEEHGSAELSRILVEQILVNITLFVDLVTLFLDHRELSGFKGRDRDPASRLGAADQCGVHQFHTARSPKECTIAFIRRRSSRKTITYYSSPSMHQGSTLPRVAIETRLPLLRTPRRCARTRRRRCSPRACSRGGDCPVPASRQREPWGPGRRCSAHPRPRGGGQ